MRYGERSTPEIVRTLTQINALNEHLIWHVFSKLAVQKEVVIIVCIPSTEQPKL